MRLLLIWMSLGILLAIPPEGQSDTLRSISIDEVYREGTEFVVVELTDSFLKENLTLGSIVLEDTSSGETIPSIPEPVENGKVLANDSVLTLVKTFRLRLTGGFTLFPDHQYVVRIDRIEDGRSLLKNESLAVADKKKTSLTVNKAVFIRKNAQTLLSVLFTGSFDEATMKIGQIDLIDDQGNHLQLDSPRNVSVEPGLVQGLEIPIQDIIFADRQYTLTIRRIADDAPGTGFKLLNQSRAVASFSGGLEFYRDTPNLVTAIFTTTVLPNPVVSVTGSDAKTRQVKIIKEIQAGPDRETLQLFLAEPLQHGDMVSVETEAERGIPIKAQGTVSFTKPKDRDASILFGAVSAVAGSGQKPNVTIDFKADYGHLVPFSRSLTFGPTIDAKIATDDKDSTNKLLISYGLHHIHIFGLKNLNSIPTDGSYDLRLAALYTDLAIRSELDKGFENRNMVGALNFSYSRPEFYPGHAFFQPSLGFEGGKNRRLEAKLRSLEGFSISRVLGKISTGFRWDKTPSIGTSFSITYEARYLTSEELDTESIPKAQRTPTSGTTRVVLDDGWKGFLTVSLLRKFSESLGVELKYENGERPVLFEDVDKATLGVTFMF